MIGKITFFNSKRAYGFVREPNLQEWFFHKSAWKEFKNPKADDLVSFSLAPSKISGMPDQCSNVHFATGEELLAHGIEESAVQK